MAKQVGESKAIRVYGPYPDRRNPRKFMMRVVDTTARIDQKVIVFGTDTHQFHGVMRKCFKRRLRRRGLGD